MEQLLSKIQITVTVFLIVVFILVTNLFASNTKPKWFSKLRQIELLVTTRQEIEKLFNYPEVVNAFEGESSKRVKYRLKEGELFISYSQGICSKTNKDGYDVEKDVVINFSMYLENEVRISKLNLDLSNFKKTAISDLVGVFTYRNEDLGEDYSGTSQKIKEITFFPTKEQEKLNCKNVLSRD